MARASALGQQIELKNDTVVQETRSVTIENYNLEFSAFNDASAKN